MAEIADFSLPSNSPLFLFGLTEYLISSFVALIAMGSLPLSLAVFLVLNKQTSSNTQFLLKTLCMADLTLSLTLLIFNVGNLGSGGYHWGPIGCYLESFLINLGASFSLTIISILALDLHTRIIQQATLDLKIIKVSLVGLVANQFLMEALPFLFGVQASTFGLNSSKLFCLVSWWDDGPVTVFTSALTGLALLLLPFLVAFAYHQILTNLTRFRGVLRDVGGGDKSTLQAGVTRMLERKIVVKLGSISALYMVFCVPPLLLISVEAITRKPSHPVIGYFVSIAGSLNAMMNPLLLICFDPVIRREVFGLVGVRWSLKEEEGGEEEIKIPDIPGMRSEDGRWGVMGSAITSPTTN